MKEHRQGTVFFDYFDAKYLINLPERTDRLQRIQKQFEKHHIPFDKITLFKGVKCREKDGFSSVGIRGCFLAHLGVLKDARNRGAERILIMEDDLGLCRDLFSHQEQVIREIKAREWDLVYFGNRIPKGQDLLAPSGIMGVLPTPARLLGCHFYAVSGRVLPRLIVYLEAMLARPGGSPEGGPMHYDGALGWFRRHNRDIIALASRSVLGIQNSSQSDIHKMISMIPFLSYFLGPVRRLKNIIKYGC